MKIYKNKPTTLDWWEHFADRASPVLEQTYSLFCIIFLRVTLNIRRGRNDDDPRRDIDAVKDRRVRFPSEMEIFSDDNIQALEAAWQGRDCLADDLIPHSAPGHPGPQLRIPANFGGGGVKGDDIFGG